MSSYNQSDTRAYSMVLDGKWDRAAGIWLQASKSSDPEVAAQAFHNLAVLLHSMAIAQEASLWSSLGPQGLLSDHQLDVWRMAFKFWHEVWQQDAFWDYMKGRIVVWREPRLRGTEVDALRAELPQSILSTSADLAAAYLEAGYLKCAAQHIRLGLDSPFGKDAAKKAYESVLAPTGKALAELCKEISEGLTKDSTRAEALHHELYRRATPLVRTMDMLDPGTEILGRGIKDEAAMVLRDATLSHAKAGGDPVAIVRMLQQALGITGSEGVRWMIQEDLRDHQQGLAGGIGASLPQCWFCGKRPADHGKAIAVKMQKPVSTGVEHVMGDVNNKGSHYRHLDIAVPRCGTCATSHIAFPLLLVLGIVSGLSLAAFMVVVPYSVPLWLGLSGVVCAGALGILPAFVYTSLAGTRNTKSRRYYKYFPPYKAAIGEGYIRTEEVEEVAS